MTIADVYSYLKDMGCGFDGSKPMVNCPEVEGILQLILTVPKSYIDPTRYYINTMKVTSKCYYAL